MAEGRQWHGRLGAPLIVLVVCAIIAVAAGGASAATYTVGPISDVSSACPGQNAEVEQAVDPKLGYVYELWMGCSAGIGFARSTNGGRSFDAPLSVPGAGSPDHAWDPAIAVAANGTVYAAFMHSQNGQIYPVVAASFDHGVTFSQVTSLIPPPGKNWGDRDFIAVGPHGTVYVTWDYGPSRSVVTFICDPTGSCAFATGDLNVVAQRSTDGGRTFSPMTYVSPGFPASGGDSGPLVIEPNGRVDVLYQGYHITSPTKYTMTPAYSYFTASDNGGRTWSPPVQVGPQAGTMSLAEWWIDGDIGRDAAGNLYATWDTQGTGAGDIGWIAYSTDEGRHWSAPIQVPPDQLGVPHIVEVTGGPAGIAYVGWLSESSPAGYAQYLRTLSIRRGWLSAPVQVSSAFGDPAVWPGDTFGISTLGPYRVVLSWGSATPATGATSEIDAAPVRVTLP